MNHDTDIYFESFEKHKGNPLMTLLGFYKGLYGNFFWSTVFYVIKHSPVWVLPIITANIINNVTDKNPNVMSVIICNIVLMISLLLLNIPMI